MPKNSKNENFEKTTVEQCKETIELKIEKRKIKKQRRAEKLEKSKAKREQRKARKKRRKKALFLYNKKKLSSYYEKVNFIFVGVDNVYEKPEGIYVITKNRQIVDVSDEAKSLYITPLDTVSTLDPEIEQIDLKHFRIRPEIEGELDRLYDFIKGFDKEVRGTN